MKQLSSWRKASGRDQLKIEHFCLLKASKICNGENILRYLKDMLEVFLRRFANTWLVQKFRFSNNPLVLKVRAKLGQEYVRFGRVSIIVPVYNTEKYVRESLESIRVQNYPDLEVWIVDDGSTDKTKQVVHDFVKRDKRFKLLSQSNKGPGAARNTALNHCTGKYLTFVDGDDALPYNALKTHVDSLQETRSDFTIGSVQRWNGFNSWTTKWVSELHAVDRLSIQLDDCAEITQDVFVWNKLFLRTFFMENVGLFPEGILYEDQEPTARAYVSSKNFDLLSTPTYFWRIRADNSSITQNKHSLQDLKDRLAVADRVKNIYLGHCSVETLKYWFKKTVSKDLRHYYPLLADASEEYFHTLGDFLRNFVNNFDQNSWKFIPIRDRLYVSLLIAQNRQGAKHLARIFTDHLNEVPTKSNGTTLSVDIEKLGILEGSIPDELLRLETNDTPIVTGINEVYWSVNNDLHIECFAYLENVPTNQLSDVNFSCSAIVNDSVIPLPANYKSTGDIPHGVPRTDFQEYNFSSFSVTIPSTFFSTLEAELVTFECFLDVRGRSASSPLLPAHENQIPFITPYVKSNGVRYEISADQKNGFFLAKHQFGTETLVVEEFKPRSLMLQIQASDTSRPLLLELENRSSGKKTSIPINNINSKKPATVAVVLPEISVEQMPGLETTWDVAISNGEVKTPLSSPARFEISKPGILRISEKPYLQIVESYWGAVVEQVEVHDSGVKIQVTISPEEFTLGPKVTLRRLDGAIIVADQQQYEHETMLMTAFFKMSMGLRKLLKKEALVKQHFNICLLPGSGAKTNALQELKWSDQSISGRMIRYRTTQYGEVEVSDRGLNGASVIIFDAN